jgi:ABC-2 type transport system permease protein
MKKLKKMVNAHRNKGNKKMLKHGSYSIAMTALMIAIVVILNLVIQEIPSKYREFDLSSQKLYTIGEQTEKILKNLKKDVKLYYIAQDGTESNDIEKLLEKYEEGSKHIKVEKKDPAVYPKFASQYTSEQLSNNSIIVECGEKNKVVDYQDMYETTVNYQTYSQQVTGFDGEGQLTSAINYVVSEDMPVLYTLTGHDELSMSESMKETIQKSNIEIRDLNLLTEEAVPEDTECLFIFSPKTDIAEDEAKKIISYLENGGKAIILSDYTEIEMPNFNSVLENYGVQPENGIILEGDQDHYIAQNQYYLLPNIESHEINSNLSSKSKYVLTALSPGIKSLENVRDTIKIDSILTTSDSAYQKTDLENMETTEKEDGDLEGPFPLAVSITEDLGDDKKTQIVYFASSAIFNDQMNATVSGANYELLSSSLSWLCGTEEDSSISIPSKSYDMTTLMVPSSDASFWSIFVTAVVPVTILLVGFGIWLKRRKQ